MTTRQLALPVALAIAALALSGCTFTANLTVPASAVAKAAAGALETPEGLLPEMDCGEKDVDLVDGTVVECVLTDPTTSTEYDATVTINEVEGTDYRVDVVVDPSPRAGTIAPSQDAEPAGITHTVSAESVAKLAADALFAEAPPYYEVDCGSGDLELALGAVFDCAAMHPQGAVHDARITVTDITETGYDIDVVRSADPRG